MHGRKLFVFLCLLVIPALGFCAGTVTIGNRYLPALPGDTGSAFFTLTSSEDDTLLSVSADCCQAVELHAHTMEGDIMRMRQVKQVSLPANAPVTFAPGGYHVMLIGLKQPLARGTKIPLTFHFAKAPAQTVLFTASAPRLQAAPDSLKHP